MKRQFHAGGKLDGQVIILQGDRRHAVAEFVVRTAALVTMNQIVIHGV